jgi:hypothetical protein
MSREIVIGPNFCIRNWMIYINSMLSIVQCLMYFGYKHDVSGVCPTPVITRTDL